jgi:hypothetical protein
MTVNSVTPAMKENKYFKRSPDSGKLQGRSIVFPFEINYQLSKHLDKNVTIFLRQQLNK